jgi:hypothetical protein
MRAVRKRSSLPQWSFNWPRMVEVGDILILPPFQAHVAIEVFPPAHREAWFVVAKADMSI